MPDLVIPTEFLDQHTGKLMHDPVQIIKCGHILDSRALAKLIINDNHRPCPFPCCENKDLKIKYLPELQRKIKLFRNANAKTLKEFEVEDTLDGSLSTSSSIVSTRGEYSRSGNLKA